MRASTFSLALFAVLFASTSAFAQGSLQQFGPRNQANDPALQDPANQLEPLNLACEAGDRSACLTIHFGRCANDNPRVAIPACTRQLGEQDNRRHGGNIRFERAILYTLRANARLKQGDVERALSDYDRAVVADNSVVWIHLQRGNAYFVEGQLEEALISYEAAVAVDPDSAAALSNRALIFAAAPDEELRDEAQALADAQRANAVAPGQPAYLDALAVAYAANGDFERAAAEERRAIDLLPPGSDDVLGDYRGRLALFERGMPYRVTPRPQS